MSHLQYLFLASATQEKGSAEVSFIPATFDMKAIIATMDGVKEESVKGGKGERGGKDKDKVGGKGETDKSSKVVKKNKEITQAKPKAKHPFARIDLRVGKIVKIEKHPNADRLYVEHVDLGEGENRIVVSGLVEHVPMEELDGRLCVFICNLKPATLCKVLSGAMLLVAKQDDGQLEPLIVPTNCQPGDKITIEGVIPQPDDVIKPKDTTWEVVRQLLKMVDGVAQYESSPLQVLGKGKIISNKIPTGIIS
jgi:aminoacyl tRNA synthase complex-interacting multifunctional protein 1